MRVVLQKLNHLVHSSQEALHQKYWQCSRRLLPQLFVLHSIPFDLVSLSNR